MKYLLISLLFLQTSQTNRTSVPFFSNEYLKYKHYAAHASANYFQSDIELDKNFPVGDYFQSNVIFWFLIYTYFNDKEIVIHDRNNLDLIYSVKDFNSLENQKVHPFAQALIEDQLIDNQISALKSSLLKIAHNPSTTDQELTALIGLVRRSGVLFDSQNHKSVFTSLSKGVRRQRGLKNHVEAGLLRFSIYSNFLENYFKAKNLPPQLLAISLLESSFNPSAISKSGASGVWQFMPHLSRSFFPTDSKMDYRLNVGISSVAAAHLLAENHQILKSWELSLTAYNSGIKHILKNKRKNPNVTLEDLIEESKGRRFGFASKNFYSEFLALSRILKFEEKLFPVLENTDSQDDLKFYFAKCPIDLEQVHGDDLSSFLAVNHQIGTRKYIPKYSLVTSFEELPAGHYQEIHLNDVLKKRPLKWINKKKNYNCSTI